MMFDLKRNLIGYKLLSTAERRGTPVLLSVSVSDNFGNSPEIAAGRSRRSRDIDQSTQRFHVGWFHVGWQGIGDQSDAVTQNAWFSCALCAAISGEISILIQTGAESWGRFPVPRICRWESRYKRPLLHNTPSFPSESILPNGFYEFENLIIMPTM